MKKLLATLLLAGLCLPTFAGDVEAGKKKAPLCSGCHGPKGIAMIDGYPNIAGQNEKYLVNAMLAYKNGDRKGGLTGVMSGIAATLDETAIEDLAAYFSQLD